MKGIVTAIKTAVLPWLRRLPWFAFSVLGCGQRPRWAATQPRNQKGGTTELTEATQGGCVAGVDEEFPSSHSPDSRLTTGNRESRESDESLCPEITELVTAGWPSRQVTRDQLTSVPIGAHPWSPFDHKFGPRISRMGTDTAVSPPPDARGPPVSFRLFPCVPWYSLDVRNLRRKQNFEAFVVRIFRHPLLPLFSGHPSFALRCEHVVRRFASGCPCGRL